MAPLRRVSVGLASRVATTVNFDENVRMFSAGGVGGGEGPPRLTMFEHVEGSRVMEGTIKVRRCGLTSG